MELQAMLLQIFNSWKYFDSSIITSHVSPRLHLPICNTNSSVSANMQKLEWLGISGNFSHKNRHKGAEMDYKFPLKCSLVGNL